MLGLQLSGVPKQLQESPPNQIYTSISFVDGKYFNPLKNLHIKYCTNT